MTNELRPVNGDRIARWVYTKEEWRHYAKWCARNKGFFNYVWHLAFRSKEPVPFIELTDQSVYVGSRQEIFKNHERTLRRVDIDEKGSMNIFHITYENANNKAITEINLPIPRGKLKEAISVLEKLMNVIKM